MQKSKKMICIAAILLFFAALSFPGAAELIAGKGRLPISGSAFEKEAATFRNKLLYSVFGESGNDSVIAGKDGWLYYAPTAGDYTGANRLTDGEIGSIADNIAALRDYCEENGAKFCFVIVPNKNTVYPENMPGKYKKSTGISDAKKLIARLNEKNVTAPDLEEMFRASGKTLYYKTDTHWNAPGAGIVADYLSNEYGGNSAGYARTEAVRTDGDAGDLYRMLFPSEKNAKPEANKYCYPDAPEFEYEEIPATMTDSRISTYGGGCGRLIVYRDSFGSELIPLLSGCFSRVVYLRFGIDFDRTPVENEKPDAVVFIIAERSIKTLNDSFFAK